TRSFRHASATSSPQRLRMTGLLVGYAANSKADCRDAAARRVSGPGPETTADRSYPDDKTTCFVNGQRLLLAHRRLGQRLPRLGFRRREAVDRVAHREIRDPRADKNQRRFLGDLFLDLPVDFPPLIGIGGP